MQLFIVFCFSFVSAAAVLTSNGIAIIRPHRSTTYVDAAYCYRWSSVVCQSVCVSRSSLCDIAVFVLKRDVKLKPNFVTIVSPAETAEQIEMPFGMWTPVGPRKHVLDGRAHWRHLANTIERPRTAAMRPVVKLL